MSSLLASLRVVVVTIAICCVGYPAVFLAVGQLIFPDSANGQLLRAADGTVVGSRLIAQAFSSDRYFWPRPSAVDYHGTGAGGSNLAPTNPVLAARAKELIVRYGATPGHPLPADLATASGSGLDPHISVAAARYQAPRVAAARGLALSAVGALIDRLVFAPGGQSAPGQIINVLELNLALDQSSSAP